MKRIRYAGGSLLTGDAIAGAVLDYATTLARADVADHVVVPAIGADGQRTTVDLVVGPASQLIAEFEAGEDDLVDEEFLAELERRSRLAAAGRIDQIGRADAGEGAT